MTKYIENMVVIGCCAIPLIFAGQAAVAEIDRSAERHRYYNMQVSK